MPVSAASSPRMAVVADTHGGGSLQPIGPDGSPSGPASDVVDLAAAVAAIESRGALGSGPAPRWVWADTAEIYPALIAAGIRVGRGHDLALTEGLLCGIAGRAGAPRSLAAAQARLEGRPVPPERGGGRAQRAVAAGQGALFGSGDGVRRGQDGSAPGRNDIARDDRDPGGTCREALDAVVAVHRDQLRRTAALPGAARVRILVAAESAAALAAAEMTADGLPWRSDIHDRLLTELLGPRPTPGARPERVVALGRHVAELLGVPGLNPDSPAQVIRAFAEVGVPIASTRSTVLQSVDHPAAPALLEYKELARLHSAYGWSWDETWADRGRLRPDYVVGGVVSGRWATRGGGGLQVPRILRGAVVADPGWVLVAADAGQLEPRLLAAISGDPVLLEIAGGPGDLYAAVASVAFADDRAAAKLALLGAMYGATTGAAGRQLANLQRRFAVAMAFLEAAARAGERGEMVRSFLGRTSPPPPDGWSEHTAGEAAVSPAARARGRFTRNFVVQASASDWASVWVAGVRRRLAADALPGSSDGAHLALFQHDEVLVHCPGDIAGEVAAAIVEAGAEATRRLFGDSPLTIPLETATVVTYADAKG